jgi:hypothetical protein
LGPCQAVTMALITLCPHDGITSTEPAPAVALSRALLYLRQFAPVRDSCTTRLTRTSWSISISMAPTSKKEHTRLIMPAAAAHATMATAPRPRTCVLSRLSGSRTPMKAAVAATYVRAVCVCVCWRDCSRCSCLINSILHTFMHINVSEVHGIQRGRESTRASERASDRERVRKREKEREGEGLIREGGREGSSSGCWWYARGNARRETWAQNNAENNATTRFMKCLSYNASLSPVHTNRLGTQGRQACATGAHHACTSVVCSARC